MSQQNITLVIRDDLTLIENQTRLLFSSHPPSLSDYHHRHNPPPNKTIIFTSPLAKASKKEGDNIMDLDIMASIHSVTHFSTLQSSPPLHSDDYPVIHYTDVFDDYQSHLRCPFCDFDIQLPLPSTDFQQDHCSALKYMVCPVCEQDLGNDANAIAQYTHSTSRKWGWKSEKSSNWSGNSEMFGKKLAGRGNKQELAADPLLSPFICNVPVPNSNSSHQDEKSSLGNKDHINIHSAKRCGTDGVEQDEQEQGLKAAFVQNLILSTIFEEI